MFFELDPSEIYGGRQRPQHGEWRKPMQAETGSQEGAPALAARGIRRLPRLTTDQKGTPMKTLRAGLTALVGATLMLVALPSIAGAATTGTTTTTFTLTGGSLSITVPGTTVNLGSVSVAASSVTGPLVTLTVTAGHGPPRP